MADNGLWDVVQREPADDRSDPGVFTGRAAAGDRGRPACPRSTRCTAPLAVRSSSRLEDDLDHPFAGVYATKMIPNNELSVDDRFRRLLQAIQFVWASTFFASARSAVAATGRSIEDEAMAVILQEVVGQRAGNRFYPCVSGVGRTYNFYPTGRRGRRTVSSTWRSASEGPSSTEAGAGAFRRPSPRRRPLSTRSPTC